MVTNGIIQTVHIIPLKKKANLQLHNHGIYHSRTKILLNRFYCRIRTSKQIANNLGIATESKSDNQLLGKIQKKMPTEIKTLNYKKE
ncbi:hypothetical protein MNV_410001 [Candidatus Methanoperedens nitroreducens]|uniref:Uncharacterized protein n=1 Tax=Candidatus Methanoperedens nitratireducens TaxID=1392998 RepID=A0A284VQN2_9EURY|nr:hypothetical protein MNV_410001 [Candidatus Methanoperedens nitroreducens]